jgi:hypothetical protein
MDSSIVPGTTHPRTHPYIGAENRDRPGPLASSTPRDSCARAPRWPPAHCSTRARTEARFASRLPAMARRCGRLHAIRAQLAGGGPPNLSLERAESTGHPPLGSLEGERPPLRAWPAAQLRPPGEPEGKIHRVGPDFGSTLTASIRDSQPNC